METKKQESRRALGRDRMIPLDQIVATGETQSREGPLRQETVDEYVEGYKRGDKFPPIKLMRDDDDGVYRTFDGYHRIAAAKAAGLTEILADIFRGSLDEAILAAAGANATHGLPRTHADRRKAVRMVLSVPRFKKMSNRAIAAEALVSDKLVAEIRKEIGEAAGPREGADGKVRKPPTKKAKEETPPATAEFPQLRPAAQVITVPVTEEPRAERTIYPRVEPAPSEPVIVRPLEYTPAPEPIEDGDDEDDGPGPHELMESLTEAIWAVVDRHVHDDPHWPEEARWRVSGVLSGLASKYAEEWPFEKGRKAS